ncbi:hypothetical protein PM082_012501 [Marasmius tenuissimus]|nr:hypothetical protein PM082_012501 [Marasmius tenuissimus]
MGTRGDNVRLPDAFNTLVNGTGALSVSLSLWQIEEVFGAIHEAELIFMRLSSLAQFRRFERTSERIWEWGCSWLEQTYHELVLIGL